MSLFNFFGPDSKQLFLDFSPQGSVWQSVSWNFDLNNTQERLWVVEVIKDQSESIEWHKLGHQEVRFFKKHKLERKQKISDKTDSYSKMMNLCIDATLKFCTESHHEFLLTPVSGATTIDYQNEARALQWLQASFGTLQRALDQFDERSDLILTAAFFSGTEPESSLKVLRLLAFNLDIFCYFQPDFSLQLAVFDDKNMGHGRAKTPVFQQNIKVTKPQIYDEIVKLVHRIARVGEIR